jgi:hypothetical protein
MVLATVRLLIKVWRPRAEGLLSNENMMVTIKL